MRDKRGRVRFANHIRALPANCEGRIGGFNFQWAWATGFIAGNAIAAGMER